MIDAADRIPRVRRRLLCRGQGRVASFASSSVATRATTLRTSFRGRSREAKARGAVAFIFLGDMELTPALDKRFARELAHPRSRSVLSRARQPRDRADRASRHRAERRGADARAPVSRHGAHARQELASRSHRLLGGPPGRRSLRRARQRDAERLRARPARVAVGGSRARARRSGDEAHPRRHAQATRPQRGRDARDGPRRTRRRWRTRKRRSHSSSSTTST